MAYSTIPKGSLYMNTKTYTGTGSAMNITGVGFQPDMTWIKPRSVVDNHTLYDAVRGVSSRLIQNLDSAAGTVSDMVTSFNSDGVSLGTNGNVTANGVTFVAWNWKGGGTGVANTDGSVATTVSANTTAGFSIVSYTGNGDSNSTFGHGLGAIPSIVITKKLTGANESWGVYADPLKTFVSAVNTRYLVLSNTGSYNNSSTVWNSTSPTNLHFTGGDNIANSAAPMIAYCFTPIKGFSKFGSYFGNNNSDGPMVYTGFKPSWVMIKRIDGANDWCIYDNKRDLFNVVQDKLVANDTAAEGDDVALDFVSNGFKFRQNGGNFNGSYEYIYMCFASNPFVATSGSDAIPVTAE